MHLTGPAENVAGHLVQHTTSLHINKFRKKYIRAGFILSNVGHLADKGYYNVKLKVVSTKGVLSIQSEAATASQPPIQLRLCVLPSDQSPG